MGWLRRPTNPATINARSVFPLAGGTVAVNVVMVVVGGLRSISLWTSFLIELSVGYPLDRVSARRRTSAGTEILIR